MSRKIDLSDPGALSQDDIDYLKARGRWPVAGAESLDEDEVVVTESEPKNYSAMTNSELRDVLAERGLESSGPKAELIDRLMAADDAEA